MIQIKFYLDRSSK